MNYKYVEFNNRSKKTILAIHGYGSDHNFLKTIFNKKMNFNLIILDLPGSHFNPTNEKLTIDFFVEYVNGFIKERVKPKKIILLGHSFGGAVSSYVGLSKRIEKIFYFSPLNPSIKKSKLFKVLKYLHSEKTKNKISSKITKKTLETIFKKKDPLMIKFIKDNPWLSLITDTIINDDKMMEIENNYINTSKKSIFLLGLNDSIIPYFLTKKFIHEINSKLYTFKLSEHNATKLESNKFIDILNSEITYKRMRFLNKIIKKDLHNEKLEI